MLEPSFFDDESKILYQEIPNSNLSKIKLSFSLDFDIGQSYVTSKIVDRDGVTRKLNIQAGQRGIKLQQDLCRIKKNQDDDDYGYGAFDKLPSYIYIKTFLKSIIPSIKTSPFDSEFNSASNGDIFIHGTSFGKILSRFFSLT